MELRELMEQFVAKLGIEGARPDADGAYHFDIDGMPVSLLEVAETGEVLTWADVGELPSEGRERFCMELLKAMFMSEGTGGAIFSIARDSGRLCLHRADALAALDFDSFKAKFERFVNVLEEWRTLLADFREVAPEQAHESKVAAESSRSLGLDDFIRV